MGSPFIHSSSNSKWLITCKPSAQSFFLPPDHPSSLSLPSCPRNIRNCSNKALLILSGVVVLARSLGWRWWQWRLMLMLMYLPFFFLCKGRWLMWPCHSGLDILKFFFLAPTTTWTLLFWARIFPTRTPEKSTTWWFAEGKEFVYSL